MGSGGGGGGGGGRGAMMDAAPMEGLPVAGANSTIGSPYEYGQFQSFLPDIQAEGQNPMATGLRPEMFEYRSPQGVVAQSGQGGEIDELRNALAKLQAAGQNANDPFGGHERKVWNPQPFAPGGP
jgi:hypothetical protein